MTTLPRMGECFAGRYLLQRPLAETPGYSAIEALDQERDEPVELWLIREELLPTPGQRNHVVRTALDFRDTEHQHIRSVLGADQVQGQAFVVVEPAAPASLRQVLDDGRPSTSSDIVLYATSIAEALEEAHERGYVHGRLIPEDVKTVDGLIKVGGIGLWSDVSIAAARRLWRPADRYLAPEVRESGALSRGADVYSLAALLVELASGRGDVLLHEAAQLLAAEQPELAGVLSPALSPAPRHRPASPVALLRGIRQVLIDDRVPTQDRPATPPPVELFAAPDGGSEPDAARAAERSIADALTTDGHAREHKETLLGYDQGDKDSAEPRPSGPRTLSGYAPGSALQRELNARNGQQGPASPADEVVERPPERSTDRFAVKGPLPGPRADRPSPVERAPAAAAPAPVEVAPAAPAPAEAATPKPIPVRRATERMQLAGPQPAVPKKAVQDRPLRTTAEAPTSYPDNQPRRFRSEPGVTSPEFATPESEPETTRWAAAREGQLPSRPPGANPAELEKKRRIRRVSSLNPLAEAIRRPGAVGPAPVSAVTMLDGTESAPPRFATAPPRTELNAVRALEGARQSADQATAPDGEEEPDTSRRFVLRNEVEASLDDPTLTSRRAAPPRPGSGSEASVDLPLRPADTEEGFEAVNLAALEADLADVELSDVRPPASVARESDSLTVESPVGEAEAPDAAACDDDEEPTKLRRRTVPVAPRSHETARASAPLATDAREQEVETGRAPRVSGGGTAARRGFPWGAFAAGLLLAGVLGVGTWYALSYFSERSVGSSQDAAAQGGQAPVADVDAASAAAAMPPSIASCPDGMVGLAPREGDGFAPFCIDVYEYPGKGQMPAVDIRFDDAQAACAERGARLCEAEEWVAGCRGPDLATYPYGVAFVEDKCNVDRGKPREIVAAGSFAECVSASGAFDMSGNVAEWTMGRFSYGGSALDRSPGRCSERKKWPAVEAKADDVGFRCCVSSDKAEQVRSVPAASPGSDAGEADSGASE